jgi:hypothetical protein
MLLTWLEKKFTKKLLYDNHSDRHFIVLSIIFRISIWYDYVFFLWFPDKESDPSATK